MLDILVTPSVTDPKILAIHVIDRHADTEGIMRAFEAYAAYPQEQGTIEMTESSIGTSLSSRWR